jgi:hypothetical protein
MEEHIEMSLQRDVRRLLDRLEVAEATILALQADITALEAADVALDARVTALEGP